MSIVRLEGSPAGFTLKQFPVQFYEQTPFTDVRAWLFQKEEGEIAVLSESTSSEPLALLNVSVIGAEVEFLIVALDVNMTVGAALRGVATDLLIADGIQLAPPTSGGHSELLRSLLRATVVEAVEE